MTYRADVKPKVGKFRFSFPCISHKWELDISKRGSNGATGAAITRMEVVLGSTKHLKLHSARDWSLVKKPGRPRKVGIGPPFCRIATAD